MSIFSTGLVSRPKKTKFSLSHDVKLTCNFGWITPTMCLEMVPGDRIKHSHQLFSQFAPTDNMVMQQFDIRTEYFFVPLRLIYAEFQKFIVGGDDGETDYVPPMISVEAALAAYPDFLSNGQLPDYLGIPSGSGSNANFKKQHISLLPFFAYQLVYNEFYRDETLIPEIDLKGFKGGDYSLDALSVASDLDNWYTELFALRRRAYPKDYFTSCLPTPQAGSPVKIPQGRQSVSLYADPDLSENFEQTERHDTIFHNGKLATVDSPMTTTPSSSEVFLGTSSESQGTIDELRTAIKLQEWKEKHSRGGGRYKETIAAHFGEIVPDYRLDRPEYLCGNKSVYNVGNLYSTDFQAPESDIVQGYPVSNINGGQVGGSFKYKVREHGLLLGFVTVMPKAAYFQGLSRMWQRFDKFEYYWPEFAHLGEQAVKSKELFANANVTINPETGEVKDDVFGYQSRYAEYKSMQDSVHGEFRGSQMLSYHDGRQFSSQPTLSKNFIEVNPSIDNTNRIFNDTLNYNHHVLIDIYHNIKMVRPMPRFGIPTI